MASVLFKWLFFFSACTLPGTMNSALAVKSHPIFMSVTEIEHNAKDKTLEISCKIFTDDFEKTLRQTYKGTVDLINPKDKAAMNKLVSDYVQAHLSLAVDGKKVALQFIGYEIQEEGVISYYQVNNIPSVKKIDVTDNILYEYKQEQIEIVHAIVGGNRKSTKLDNPADKYSFEF
jgi:phosphopantothenoylcysteine synthetase/decarboxylase